MDKINKTHPHQDHSQFMRPLKRSRASSPATPLPPSPEFPDEVITNILSFLPIIGINKKFSESLLKIYKETIVKRLDVEPEIVDALKNSDVVHIFQKLNDESIKAAKTMGFSLKQIATIPVDQLSKYKTQFDDYGIPKDIQIQINNLSVNGELKLHSRNLTTGQLCKILNALTDDQRNALGRLYLHKNQLTSLPDSIGGLSNLTYLALDDNQLTFLPDSIGYLSALRVLDLSNNQLTSLPDLIGGLSNLTVLALDDNQLTSLPNSFGNMSALESLYLLNNQLTSLPDSIGDLSNLTELYLSNNQLTSLPDSIGDLSNLTELYLSRNQLTSLPDSIGGLSNLTELILRGNNFDDDFKPAIKQQFPFAEL